MDSLVSIECIDIDENDDPRVLLAGELEKLGWTRVFSPTWMKLWHTSA